MTRAEPSFDKLDRSRDSAALSLSRPPTSSLDGSVACDSSPARPSTINRPEPARVSVAAAGCAQPLLQPER